MDEWFPPTVALIVLTWNQRDLTLDCLASLAALDYPAGRLEILVVDNGSVDGTAEAVRAAYPGVTVLETGENLGYAGGNNVGIRYALERGADYVCILNNDVTVAPEALSALVRVAQQEPEAGLLGPKVYHRERPDTIQSAGIVLDRYCRSEHRGKEQMDVGQLDEVEAVDAVVGCALLVSRSVIETVGLFDTRYYMYREEIDWCCRARAQGFRVLYVPEARVWHRDAQVRTDALPRITYYMTRNTYLLLRARDARWTTRATVALRDLVWLVNWTINPKWRQKRSQRDALFKALVDVVRGNYGKQSERFGT